MLVRECLLVVAVMALMGASTHAQGDQDKTPVGSWMLKPNTGISDLWLLVEKEKGWAIGTRTAVTVDGARVAHTSFKISGRAWRCVEIIEGSRKPICARCHESGSLPDKWTHSAERGNSYAQYETGCVAAVVLAEPTETSGAKRKRRPRQVAESYVVQLWLLHSRENILEEWTRLQIAWPDLLEGMKPDVVPLRSNRSATRYRVHIGSFADYGAAKAFCERLKSNNQDCLPVRAAEPVGNLYPGGTVTR